MTIISKYLKYKPNIHPTTWIDISARLIGQINLSSKSSVWPNAVLRAEEAKIDIGEGSAILDLALIEAPINKPVTIESEVLISHQTTIHGALIRKGSLVGIGAIVLDGAEIGPECLVGAGSIVLPNTYIPSGKLLLGQPAKIIRDLNIKEKQNIVIQLKKIQQKAKNYLKIF